jgi:hypothetical protein
MPRLCLPVVSAVDDVDGEVVCGPAFLAGSAVSS